MFLKILACAALLSIPVTNKELPDLAIGDAAPATELKLKDITGDETDLRSITGANGLLVIFSCNTCPFVVGSEGSEGWQGRYPALAKDCADKGIGFVLVNSNDAKRDAGDSFADMQQQYKEQGYAGHYLLDQGHAMADAFGARTTPHVYLFTKDLKLAYKGAIDDNVESPSAVKEHWLNEAVAAVAAGKTPDPATTRNIGCSIKRGEARK
ncbi:MAG: redoxin family protein [Flavobacteriales bacterium]